MSKSHAVGRASQPTPAQMKEFFAQVESGRITKASFQAYLRGNAQSKNEPLSELPEPIDSFVRRSGFIPADSFGRQVNKEISLKSGGFGFLLPVPDCRTFVFRRHRLPFLASVSSCNTKQWTMEVFGSQHAWAFYEMSREMEEIYGVNIVTTVHDKQEKEIFELGGDL